jgi:hypothetical protein
MSITVKINEELQNYLPKLSEEEYNTLTDSILRDGVRDPIITWKETTDIIDGYNRYAICIEHNLGFNIKSLSFPTIEDVKEWMLQNQLGRRNLTVEKQKYFRAELFSVRKKKHGGDRKSEAVKSKCQVDTLIINEMAIQDGIEIETSDTAEQIAQEYGVSRKTIYRDEDFKEAVDKLEEYNPGIKAKILNGEVKLTQDAAQEVLKADEKLQKNIAITTGMDVKKAINNIKKQDSEWEEKDINLDSAFDGLDKKLIQVNLDLSQLIECWDLVKPDAKLRFKNHILMLRENLKKLENNVFYLLCLPTYVVHYIEFNIVRGDS